MTEKRLNKFISESGFCSRREADALIEQRRVTINGQIPELGTKVQPGDSVEVDGKRIRASAADKGDRIYIAYNKPIGITCTTERDVRGNIIDAIGHKKRIFPIGRLDKPSEGLIFLTSDGDIVNKILRAENAHDKEYVVTVDKPISERFVDKMSRGVPILGTVTQPCTVTPMGKFVFKIILTQGLNRQIRRMCEFLGYEVTALKRTRIMNVSVEGLRPGQWRDLTTREMAEINAAVAHSSKTARPDQIGAAKRIKPGVREDKPRSGNPRRPGGMGEGRGVLNERRPRRGDEESGRRPARSEQRDYEPYRSEQRHADRPRYDDKASWSGGRPDKGGRDDQRGYAGKSDRNDKRSYAGKPGRDDQRGYAGKPGRDDQRGYADKPGRDDQRSYGGKPGRDDQRSYGGKPGRDDQRGYGGKPGRDDKRGYADKPARADKPKTVYVNPNAKPSSTEKQPEKKPSGRTLSLGKKKD